MPKEPAAEAQIRTWLNDTGYDARKGVHVDVEAWRGAALKWVIEVKGDQMNDRAVRNSFLTGLGQLAVARARHPGVRVSYGITEMYREMASKYADVLDHHGFSVVWVGDAGIQFVGASAKSALVAAGRSSSTRGQGHADGRFRCGTAEFLVSEGRLTSVRIAGKRRHDVGTFAKLCRLLGLEVGGDSAPRILARSSEAV